MQSCRDWQGREVAEGQTFLPKKEDMCMECVCNAGVWSQCRTASCALPPCSPYEVVPEVCCQFKCMSDDGSPRNSTIFFMNDSLTTAGVRLVASTLTCVMILLLIVFFMHKLRRHRRFLLNVPQVFQRGRGDTLGGHNEGSSGCGSNAPPPFSVHYHQLHDDPPPPYVPPKVPLPCSNGSNTKFVAPNYPGGQLPAACSCAPGGPYRRCTWKLGTTGTGSSSRCQCCAPSAASLAVFGKPQCRRAGRTGGPACRSSAADVTLSVLRCPAAVVAHCCHQFSCCNVQAPSSAVAATCEAASVAAAAPVHDLEPACRDTAIGTAAGKDGNMLLPQPAFDKAHNDAIQSQPDEAEPSALLDSLTAPATQAAMRDQMDMTAALNESNNNSFDTDRQRLLSNDDHST